MKKKILTLLTAALSAAKIMSLSAMTAFAEGEEAAAETTKAAATTAGLGGSILGTLVIPLLIMFALLYFIAIKPQKKQEKELKAMQSSLQVGDEIVTGGGIVGIVVSVGDDTVVIETGGAKHKLRIKTWAITENVTATERMKADKASSKKTDAGLASAAVVDDDDDAPKKKKKDKKEKKESSEKE